MNSNSHPTHLLGGCRGTLQLARSVTAAACLLLAAAAFWLSVSSQTQAALGTLFIVNSAGDEHDAFPGDGRCETQVGNGVCTLRAALEEVVSRRETGGDGITFKIPTNAPGCNSLVPGACVIETTSPFVDLSVSVTISGPGSATLIVDGLGGSAFEHRIFNVTTSGTVSISGITIADGAAPTKQNGGGIQNASSGTVNVTNCAITGNSSGRSDSFTNGGGGGIFNASNGTVNVTNSTFEFNQATAVDFAVPTPGGAIYNKTGFLNVTDSTFTSNNTTDSGGAVANEGGVVSITGSTFHDNGAFNRGGAISGSGGTVIVTNSTFYGNIAYGSTDGGDRGFGAAIANGPGTLNLSNSTVTANFCGTTGCGVGNGYPGVANVKSSIIAGNFGGISRFGQSPDVYGAFSSKGFNLIGKKDGSTGFMGTDKKGTVVSPLNPKLDPRGLRDNGGPTQTVALMTGSPAIDKGTSIGLSGTLTTDQRGFSRTVDNTSIPNATGGDGTDIGAFEFGAQ